MESQPGPPNVFAHLNSREFIRDFLQWGKEQKLGFTHRVLLEKMEVSSTGFIANVIAGKSNLNARQAQALAEIFKLNPAEARFFLTLVAYTQSRTIEEKGDALDSMRAQVRGRNKKLDPRQYSLFSKWLYPMVFDLIAMLPIRDDHKAIADLFDSSVKPDDVRKALEVLEGLSLVRKREDGSYEQMHAAVGTGDEILSTDVVKFQQTTLKKAIEALDGTPPEERSISVTTIPLSAEGLERVKQEARIFRDRLLRISGEDRGYERIYQLNLNLFPATKRIPKGEA
jgi:uncharacterized protein (TIGR02147 family)